MLTIEASKIKEVMMNLDNLSYQKILFDGPWGIGKTKYILDSIKNQDNIYYISLFGKNNINTFYEELYYLLLSVEKVKLKKTLKYLKELNISQFGLNISIPLMSDILKNIQKELAQKSSIAIIIDDLERKNDSFKIKEIFGFIDSITKNEDIKVILLASSQNLPGSDSEKEIFENYAEKSIDRIYKITSPSKTAPQEILGKEIWDSIKNLYIDNELKNLRTLEKTKFFIDEVIQQVGVDSFNEKFNKEDLYKICAAVIIFLIEHNKETLLLPDLTDDDLQNAFYNTYKHEENHPSYIAGYILDNKLKNRMMQNFIPFILEWFETGDFSKEQLNNLYEEINSYKESQHPIFMSDDQIQEEISEFETLVNNLDKNILIKNFIERLDELAFIVQGTSFEFTYSVDDIVERILNSFDLNDSFDDTYFSIKSRLGEQLIEELKVKSLHNYINKISSKMIHNLEKRKFNEDDVHLVNEFKNLYMQLSQNEKKELINQMENNKWLLPFPYGEITDKHWTYCHRIFSCIKYISDGEGEIIKENAREYFYREIEDSPDEIFKYRMKSLMKRYLG